MEIGGCTVRVFRHGGTALLTACIVSVVLVPPTRAAQPGCPQDWDTSVLSPNMTTSQWQSFFGQDFETILRPPIVTEHSFDGKTWIRHSDLRSITPSLPALNTIAYGNLSPALTREKTTQNLLGYFGDHFDGNGNGIIGDLSFLNNPVVYSRVLHTIEKRGCGPATTFAINNTYETPKIVFLDFETEFSKLERSFLNYEAAESFKALYYKCLSTWKGLENSKSSIIPVNHCGLGNVHLRPMKPGCLAVYPGDVNRADGRKLVPGSDCEYLIMGFNGSNPLNAHYTQPGYDLTYAGSVLAFGTLRIKAPAISTTITCAKGKVRKVIKGTKPVCPKGYKRVK